MLYTRITDRFRTLNAFYISFIIYAAGKYVYISPLLSFL